MAFGDIRGTLQVAANSITNPTNLAGSVAVVTGDLVFVVLGEQTSLTAGACTSSFVTTYTATNAGLDSGTVTGQAYWGRVTSNGTLTQISVAATASADNVSAVAVVFEGPFLPSPLDANPSPLTEDIASPFTTTTTGTLAQADELIVAFSINGAAGNWTASSPNVNRVELATQAILTSRIGSWVVSSTSSVSASWTGTNPTDSVLGINSFRKDTIGPHNQDYWPVTPPHPRSFDLRTWIWNLTIELPIPVEYMGYPYNEWPPAPAPERAIDLRTWISNPKTLRAEPIFYSGLPSSEWPPSEAPGRSADLRTWVQNPITLRPPAQAPAGEQAYDRPPLGPLRPSNLGTWTWNLLQSTLAPVQMPVGKGLTELPPAGPLRAADLRTWVWSYNENLIAQDEFPPGEHLSDLPPRAYPEPATRTWIETFNLSLIGQDRLPVGEQRTELPPKAYERSIQLRSWTWSYNLNLIAQDEFPVGEQTTELSPEGPLQPPRGWIQSLVNTTLAPEFGKPFVQEDWPVPYGPSQPVRSWTFAFNLNLVGQDEFPAGDEHYDLSQRPLQPPRSWTWSYNINLIGQDELPPGEELYDRPPLGHIYPNQQRTWISFLPLALITAPPEKPFNQEDWPVPYGPRQPDRTWLWSYNLNLRGQDQLPTGEQRTELPPKAYPEPATRTWIWNFNQNLIGQDRLPVGEQRTELSPKGHIHPQQLRTWTQSFNQNLRGQDQLPVGERLTDLPPQGPLHPQQIRTWINAVNLALTQEPVVVESVFPASEWQRAPEWPDNAWLRTWSYRPPNLSIPPAVKPFNQQDWPTPKGYQYPQANRSWTAFYNRNLIGKDVLPPGEQIYARPPIAHPYYDGNRTWFNRISLPIITPPPPKPHNQMDWPVPRGYPYPQANRSWLHPLNLCLPIPQPPPPTPTPSGEVGPFTPGWEWQAYDRMWDKRWYEDHVGWSEVE